MCQRQHTLVLPFSAVKHLPGVEISPPGVIDQRDRRPRTISDLTYSGVNQSTVDLTANESMQFGRALRRILLNIYRADPRWGPVYMQGGHLRRVLQHMGERQRLSEARPHPPLEAGRRPSCLSFPGVTDGLGVVTAGVLHGYRGGNGPGNACFQVRGNCSRLHRFPPHKLY